MPGLSGSTAEVTCKSAIDPIQEQDTCCTLAYIVYGLQQLFDAEPLSALGTLLHG